ncbi:hypothetical protein STEG23_009986 [Scotinomys teguina]
MQNKVIAKLFQDKLGSHYVALTVQKLTIVDQAGFELRDLSASGVLEFKVCTTMSRKRTRNVPTYGAQIFGFVLGMSYLYMIDIQTEFLLVVLMPVLELTL